MDFAKLSRALTKGFICVGRNIILALSNAVFGHEKVVFYSYNFVIMCINEGHLKLEKISVLNYFIRGAL